MNKHFSPGGQNFLIWCLICHYICKTEEFLLKISFNCSYPAIVMTNNSGINNPFHYQSYYAKDTLIKKLFTKFHSYVHTFRPLQIVLEAI